MEGETYLAPGYQLRLGIEERAVGWKRFGQIAEVTLPNRTKGTLVPEEHGVAWLAPTQVFSIKPVARKWLASDKISNAGQLQVKAGQILITRSGNVGKALMAPKNLENLLISDDLLRVHVSDPALVGWLYAFLQSPKARLMMTSSHYGQIIKHLEPAHLEALPVPIVKASIAARFQKNVTKVLSLRNESHEKTGEAERLFEAAVGPIKLDDIGETGFATSSTVLFSRRRRLEGHFHNPAARQLFDHLTKKTFSHLAEVGYKRWVPGRYKRIPIEQGVIYYDSSDLLEYNPRPQKRFADCSFGDEHKGRVKEGWILIPCSGQIYGIIGTPCLAGKQLENGAVSNHVLRLAPTKASKVRAGYLLTALSHPTLGRPLLKSYPFGSSVPEIDPNDLDRFPVVRLGDAVETKIATFAEQAAKARSEADQIEREIAEEAEQLLARFLAGDVQDFVVTVTEGSPSSDPMATLSEYDCVKLVSARPEAGLSAGAVGAIVHVYPGKKGFEVEFPRDGTNPEVLTLKPEEIAPVKK